MKKLFKITFETLLFLLFFMLSRWSFVQPSLPLDHFSLGIIISAFAFIVSMIIYVRGNLLSWMTLNGNLLAGVTLMVIMYSDVLTSVRFGEIYQLSINALFALLLIYSFWEYVNDKDESSGETSRAPYHLPVQLLAVVGIIWALEQWLWPVI